VELGLPGVLLEKLSWTEAEKCLTAETVVVIPLGASCKEHGPHLPLNNDWLIAEYLKDRVLESGADIVVTPTIGYSFYPAFKEYPGSISLKLETARDLVIDTCRSLHRFGPRRFYVLNTGVSTVRALEPARLALFDEKILLAYAQLDRLWQPVSHLKQQEGGGHADEVETSVMLYIAPQVVQMGKAVKDYQPGKGRLTRVRDSADAVYSASGVWGDPTLATVEKGRIFTEALVKGVLADIEELRAQK
jgi:creatinine amidohydrolase